MPAWRIMIIVYLMYTMIGTWMLKEKCYRPTEITPIALITGWMGLHGLVPAFCNRIIPGGWYVGTLMLLYVLTPLFMKIMQQDTRGGVYCLWLSCIVLAAFIAFFAGKTELFDNNTYGYYSVLIQSGAYLLGMRIAHTQIWKGNAVWLGVWLVFTIILYFSHLPLSFLIVPFTAALGFECFWKLIKTPSSKQWKNWRITKLVCMLGRKSYYIFLTHILVVWYLAEYVQRIIIRTGMLGNGTLLYAILLIPEIMVTAVLSLLLEKTERTVISWRRGNWGRTDA